MREVFGGELIKPSQKPTEVGGRSEAKETRQRVGNERYSINDALPTVGKGAGIVFMDGSDSK